MTNRLFALALALLFTLAPFADVSAGTPAPADWSAVQSLTPGEKVAVNTKDGDRLKGRFESANDTDIIFVQNGHKVTLRRDTIKRVQVGHKNRLLGALVGAGIGVGAGAGAGVGLIVASDNWGFDPLPVGVAVGAGVGAAIGAATGIGNDYHTVYEAQ
jgi:hypothetical protein